MKGMVAVAAIFILLLISPGCEERSEGLTLEVFGADSLQIPSWVDAEVLDSVEVGIRRSESAGEVPIGAALVVDAESGRRIFVGSNAMSSHASGHAEVMALQSAIDALGADAIRAHPLRLVTSFEPCPMCTSLLGDIWKLDPSNVAVLMSKKSEWRDDELRRVDEMRSGWILTGLDSLQRQAFCRDAGYADRYPGDCE